MKINKSRALQSKTERIHSLDSLRAVMMLLGLVLHSAITYGTVDYGNSWALKDPNSVHLTNDLIVIFIHSFRMPIFFVVAGFFGAMLFYERKPLIMVKNRASRIIYPFIAFLIIFSPLIIFANSYTAQVFSANEIALETAFSNFSNPWVFLPQMTFHLWFLYYLILITTVSVLLALIFRRMPILSGKISECFSWIIQRPLLRVLTFAIPTFAIYSFMGIDQVETSMSLNPNLNIFVFYFYFYIVGWVLFKSKHLLKSMMRLDWVSIILGAVLLLTYIFTIQLLNFEIKIMISSLVVWLFIFGITGLFIRYGSKYSARMRYISDASYWVYLCHFSFTILIPSLILDWPISATLKFLIVLLGTTTICFITYHYFVRATFIGKFLNGRRYLRRLSDIKTSKNYPELEHLTKQETGSCEKPSPA